MKWKISGLLVLYVGGRWEQRWHIGQVVMVWVKGKKLLSERYNGRSDQQRIIKKWIEIYELCEVGIIPDLSREFETGFDVNEKLTWSGKRDEFINENRTPNIVF